jgi:hypothetical protein
MAAWKRVPRLLKRDAPGLQRIDRNLVEPPRSIHLPLLQTSFELGDSVTRSRDSNCDNALREMGIWIQQMGSEALSAFLWVMNSRPN